MTFSVKLSSDRTTFRDWNVKDWTFRIKEYRIQHAIWCFATARNDRSVALRWNPNLILSLKIRLKMIDPGFITCNYLFQTTWVTFIIFSITCDASLTRLCFCSSVSKWSTQRVQILCSPSRSRKTFKTLDEWMPLNSSISCTVQCASSSVNFFTVATFFFVKTETGLPTRGSFSIDSRPSLKRRTHLQTVAYFKAPFP